MSKIPLVSIITVVFNGERYLAQTINSVLNQTYKNIEYIIIDGGSTDGTIDLIKKYENHIDYWISEPDKGLYDAMNKGISKAKGDLIGMINSDDWYELDAVKIVVEAFMSHPDKKIFHADRFNVYENDKKDLYRYHPSKFKFLYKGMTYNHPSMFVHSDIYKDYRYNTQLVALSDYEFMLTQVKVNPHKIFYIPVAIVNYRLDGVSAQMNFIDSIKEGYIARKNAGLNIFQNILAFGVKMFIALFVFFKIR